MSVNPDALDWFAAITLVAVSELVATVSFLPAYRHHWRRWRTVRWAAEWPYMWPPVFLNGAMWFVLHAVNGMAAWAVLRRGWRGSGEKFDEHGGGHTEMALWTAALGVWSLWAVPWEHELPMWSWVAWSAAAWLASAASWVAWWNGNTLAMVLFSVYASCLGVLVCCNWVVWQYRRWFGASHPAQVLHTRVGNPLAEWWHWGALPPLYDNADGE